MQRIQYSYKRPGGNRRHFIDADDVNVVLSRLPEETWERLRAVHFNDRSWGRRTLGYVGRTRTEIAICALPVRVSLSKFLVRHSLSRALRRRSPQEFGAMHGRQWPELAVRRFLLYYVFLHELGHLQIFDPSASQAYRRFGRERIAQEFSDYWRTRLWAESFEHVDPVHNRPIGCSTAIGVENPAKGVDSTALSTSG